MRSLIASIALAAMATGLAQAQPGPDHTPPQDTSAKKAEAKPRTLPVAIVRDSRQVAPNPEAQAAREDAKAAPAPEQEATTPPGADREAAKRTRAPGEVQSSRPDPREQAADRPSPSRGRQGAEPPGRRDAARDNRERIRSAPARIASSPSLSDVQRFRLQRRAPLDGCPPGLAKKYTGCAPPGQFSMRARRYAPSYFALQGARPDSYYYDDGYLVRLGDENRISSYIPLLGGALSLGALWPQAYSEVTVPDYYRDFYDLGPDDSYRYADDVIYRVDPASRAITAIATILTGDQISVGDRLPAGYGVYNVPLGYRDRYDDGADAIYRYGDGYIYRADPQSRIVSAIIELLT